MITFLFNAKLFIKTQGKYLWNNVPKNEQLFGTNVSFLIPPMWESKFCVACTFYRTVERKIAIETLMIGTHSNFHYFSEDLSVWRTEFRLIGNVFFHSYLIDTKHNHKLQKIKFFWTVWTYFSNVVFKYYKSASIRMKWPL